MQTSIQKSSPVVAQGKGHKRDGGPHISVGRRSRRRASGESTNIGRDSGKLETSLPDNVEAVPQEPPAIREGFGLFLRLARALANR